MAAENSAKYDKRLNYEKAFVMYVIIYGYTCGISMWIISKVLFEEKLKNFLKGKNEKL